MYCRIPVCPELTEIQPSVLLPGGKQHRLEEKQERWQQGLGGCSLREVLQLASWRQGWAAGRKVARQEGRKLGEGLVG